MRWTHGSTTSPEPDSTVLLTQPDLTLLDPDGEAEVLCRLVALLDAGLPMQVRHRRHHCPADADGPSAEAVLTRQLAAAADVWATELVGATPRDGVDISSDETTEPSVVTERPTYVEL